MENKVGDFFYGGIEHMVNKPLDAFVVGYPVHGTDMEKLRFAFDLVLGIEFLRIDTVRDVDRRGGGVFSEKSSVFMRDGGNAVNLIKNGKLEVFQCLCQMLYVDFLRQESGFFGNAFPNQVLDVVGAKHDKGFRMFPDGVDVGGHVKHFQLNHVKLFAVQHLDEPFVEVI